MASEVSCGAGVVVVHAVEAAGALPHEHHGHLGLAQEGTVAGCEDRGEEHDAVHGMSLEEFEVLELALGVVIGVGQEHLAAAFTQHLADTGGDAADGLGVDLGHDDADDARGTGAQRSGLRGGRVPGALDRLANPLALVIRQVAAVQIARHRSTGDACELRHFLDRHDAPPSLVRTMIPSVLHGSRRTRPQNGRVAATELPNRTRRKPPPPDFPELPRAVAKQTVHQGAVSKHICHQGAVAKQIRHQGAVAKHFCHEGPVSAPFVENMLSKRI